MRTPRTSRHVDGTLASFSSSVSLKRCSWHDGNLCGRFEHTSQLFRSCGSVSLYLYRLNRRIMSTDLQSWLGMSIHRSELKRLHECPWRSSFCEGGLSPAKSSSPSRQPSHLIAGHPSCAGRSPVVCSFKSSVPCNPSASHACSLGGFWQHPGCWLVIVCYKPGRYKANFMSCHEPPSRNRAATSVCTTPPTTSCGKHAVAQAVAQENRAKSRLCAPTV